MLRTMLVNCSSLLSFIGSFLTVAIISVWIALANEPQSYDEGYNRAVAALEAGQTENARQIIQGLLKLGDKAELHNLLAEVEEASGNIEEAARQYQMAARMDPSEKNVFDFADDLLTHRDYPHALEIFDYGAKKFQQSARLRVGLGVTQYSLGQYKQAVESLCEAVDLDPKDTRALDFIGKMYDVAPELASEVTERLEHFATLYPNNAAANYYYALSLRKRGTNGGTSDANRKAELLLERATELNPTFADAHYQLGLLWEDEGQDAKAVQEYEAAARLNDKLKAAHYRLARLYAKAGRRAESRKEFQIVQSLEAGH